MGEACTVAEALTRIPPRYPIELPEIACVMLTSYADDEALIASIMAGAACYVLKQVGSLDLIATAHEYLFPPSAFMPGLFEAARVRRDVLSCRSRRVPPCRGRVQHAPCVR